MIAAEVVALLSAAASAGVEVYRSDEGIKFVGPADVVKDHLPALRPHRQIIFDLLTCACGGPLGLGRRYRCPTCQQIAKCLFGDRV